MAFARVSVKPVLAMSLLTALLLWLSFTPVDAAPLAWIAFVPLCLVLRVSLLPRYSYAMITISGLIWAVATMQWMRLGHWTMYGALAAMAFYLSLYFPMFVAVSRSLIRRRWPLWLVVPLTWTSLEFLRAYLFTGFSWYYLGHTQYQWTSLVQISDITGAYGVSFLVAMLSAALAQLVSPNIIVKLGLAGSLQEVLPQTARQQTVGIIVPLVLVAVSCVYGFVRMQPLQPDQDGPVVAVVQGNFTPELKHDPDQWRKMVNDHDLLTRRAAASSRGRQIQEPWGWVGLFGPLGDRVFQTQSLVVFRPQQRPFSREQEEYCDQRTVAGNKITLNAALLEPLTF
jgi:apolipoprotein N-acyltransferase